MSQIFAYTLRFILYGATIWLFYLSFHWLYSEMFGVLKIATLWILAISGATTAFWIDSTKRKIKARRENTPFLLKNFEPIVAGVDIILFALISG